MIASIQAFLLTLIRVEYWKRTKMKPKKIAMQRKVKICLSEYRKDMYCAEATNHHLQSRETNKRSKAGNTSVQEFVNTA